MQIFAGVPWGGGVKRQCGCRQRQIFSVFAGYFLGLPKRDLDRLQSVINAAARLTTGARRYDHVTLLLKDLHWLRVPERITYKLCVLVYNCLHGSVPHYLQEVIQPVAEVTSRRRLRSSSSSALLVPVTQRTTLGDRAFAVAGPRAVVLGISYQTSSSTVRHHALSNNISRLIYSVYHFEHITTRHFMTV